MLLTELGLAWPRAKLREFHLFFGEDVDAKAPGRPDRLRGYGVRANGNQE